MTTLSHRLRAQATPQQRLVDGLLHHGRLADLVAADRARLLHGAARIALRGHIGAIAPGGKYARHVDLQLQSVHSLSDARDMGARGRQPEFQTLAQGQARLSAPGNRPRRATGCRQAAHRPPEERPTPATQCHGPSDQNNAPHGPRFFDLLAEPTRSARSQPRLRTDTALEGSAGRYAFTAQPNCLVANGFSRRDGTEQRPNRDPLATRLTAGTRMSAGVRKQPLRHQPNIQTADQQRDEHPSPLSQRGATSAPIWRRSAVNNTSGIMANGSCRLSTT